MGKKFIKSDKFRKPVGPFSWGVKGGEFIFLAGMVGITMEGELVGKNDVKKQARQALENIKSTLELAGCGVQNIVKTTTYLKNPSDYSKFNEVRTEFFRENSIIEDFPASTTVQASLVRDDLLIEIEAIAYVG